MTAGLTNSAVSLSLGFLRTGSAQESLARCLEPLLLRKSLLFCHMVCTGLVYEAVFLFWQDHCAPRQFFPLEVAGKLLLQELLDERTRLGDSSQPSPQLQAQVKDVLERNKHHSLRLVDKALGILQTIF